MNIIKNSDIAYLILGYLRDQNLEEAAISLCRTSPYLKDEYRLLKKGLKTMILGSGTLVDIVQEHCLIKSKISKLINTLPAEKKERILEQNSIVGKISCITKMIGEEKVTEKKENSTRNYRKRTRSLDSLDNLKTIKPHGLLGFEVKKNLAKRRKSTSYICLDNLKIIDDDVTNEEEENEKEEEIEKQELSADGSEKSKKSSSLLETDTTAVEEINAVTENVTENQIGLNLSPDTSITLQALFDKISKNNEFQYILVEAQQTSVQNNNSEKNSQKDDVDTYDQSDITAQIDELIEKVLEKNPMYDEVHQGTISVTNSDKKSVSDESDLQTHPRIRNKKPLSQCQSNKDCIFQKNESEKNCDVPSKILNSNDISNQKSDNCIRNGATTNAEINQSEDESNKKISDSDKKVLKGKENEQNQSKDKKIKMKNTKKNKTQKNEASKEPASKLETENNNREEETITLEKWKEMRASFSSSNWDQHLRALQAKSSINSVKLNKSSSKKCKQRNKSGDKSGSKSTKRKDRLNDDRKLDEDNKMKNNSANEKSTGIDRSSIDDLSKNEMDVLEAFEVSTKKQSHSKKCPVSLTKENKKAFYSALATTEKVIETYNVNDNATTGDSIENDVIKIRTAAEYDSHDSGESAKIRNAEFQKNSNLKVDQSQNKNKHDQPGNDTEKEKNQIFLKPVSTSTNALENSGAKEKTVRRSLKSGNTYQTRQVQILPKNEFSLAKSSKLFSKKSQNQTRTIQTTSLKKLKSKLENSKASEVNAPRKIKSHSLTQSNTQLKMGTRKPLKTTTESSYKIMSSIVLKKLRVVLKRITEDQLSAIPVKQQTYEDQEKNTSSNKNNKEKSFSSNEKISTDIKSNEEESKYECGTVRSDNEDVNNLENLCITMVDDTVQIQTGVVGTVDSFTHHELQEHLKPLENEKLDENCTTNNVDLLDDNKDDDEGEKEDDDHGEYDPYDDCEMVTIDENDRKRFIKIKHSEHDETKKSQLAINTQKTIIEDFDKNLKTKTNIFLNDISHTMEVTNEIEPFSKQNYKEITNENEIMMVLSSAPLWCRQLINNVPKKRGKSAHILHYYDGSVSPGLEQKLTQTMVQSNPIKNITTSPITTTTATFAVPENDDGVSNVDRDNVADCPKSQQNSSAEMIETKKLCRRNIVVAKRKINKKTAFNHKTREEY